MNETRQTPQEPLRMGVIFRLGGRSWFWGRGTAHARNQPVPSPQAERWPGLGEWLRQMHAADRPPLHPAASAAGETKPARDNVADTPVPCSSGTRGIRFVCNRRVIGLLIN